MLRLLLLLLLLVLMPSLLMAGAPRYGESYSHVLVTHCETFSPALLHCLADLDHRSDSVSSSTAVDISSATPGRQTRGSKAKQGIRCLCCFTVHLICCAWLFIDPSMSNATQSAPTSPPPTSPPPTSLEARRSKVCAAAAVAQPSYVHVLSALDDSTAF